MTATVCNVLAASPHHLARLSDEVCVRVHGNVRYESDLHACGDSGGLIGSEQSLAMRR